MKLYKNIFIVSAVYPPEPVVSARMSQELAKYLTCDSYKVVVICPQPSRPANVDYRLYMNTKEPVVLVEDGIEVVRLPSFTAPDSHMLPRLYESWSFGSHVCQYLSHEPRKPDILYINAWPLLAQAQICSYAKRNKIPAILQIMDIYPEALFAKLPSIVRCIVSLPLMKLDASIARKARSVVVISDNMRRIYTERRNISKDRVVTIPTWQDDSLFENVCDRIAACSRYGISHELFTFLYLGNIGPVAGVDFLIRAFRKAALVNAQLVIVGEGSAKPACIKLVDHMNASNVHFLSDLNPANVPLLQCMADVCLLPMKKGTGMSSIPSKLPAYLFSKKPVLATVDSDSDTARLIHEADCGWVGAAEDLDWLANKMSIVASMSSEELSALGEKGKAFGRILFSKLPSVKRLADIITSG